jgi:hypothetical protein
MLLSFIAVGSPAQAKAHHSLRYRVNAAPVTQAWEGPLEYYTGNYYGVSLVNTMWQHAPTGKRREVVLDAATAYRVPLRLLLGVWGIESGYGRAWNNFGLIGPANGDLRHDAFISAKLFDKMYRSWYHHPAV